MNRLPLSETGQFDALALPWPRRRTGALGALLGLAILPACGGSTPPVDPGEPEHRHPPALPIPTPREVRVDPNQADVLVVARPAALQIDGDLSEWRDALAPKTPSSGPPLPPPPRGRWPRSNPAVTYSDVTAPGSHVALALSPDGLAIAADLSGAASQGVWIGFLIDREELPPIGRVSMEYDRVEPLACEFGPDERPLDANEKAKCDALVAKHEQDAEAYSRRFRRTFRLDRSGLRVLRNDDTLADVPGSQFVFMDHGQGITVETTVPVALLPRAITAPVTSSSGAVLVAPEAPVVRFGIDDHVRFDLPVPVDFQPRSALRAAVFDALQPERYSGYHSSYQPGDDLDTETVEYAGKDTLTLVTRRAPLYTKDSTFGPFEIGYAKVAGVSLVVLRDGAYVDIGPLAGELKGTRKVGDELHACSYAHYPVWTGAGQPGHETAFWQCVAVGPDGKVRMDLLPDGDAEYEWTTATPFQSKDLSSFGIRGKTTHRPPVQTTLTWTYHPEQKVYVADVQPKVPPAEEDAEDATAPTKPTPTLPGKPSSGKLTPKSF